MTTKKDRLNKKLLECFHGANTKPVAEKLIDARRCLEQRADVNTKDEYSGNTPLHFAARHEKVIVKMLLKRGADVKARNKRGDTPLHVAVMAMRFSTVRMLLDHGADVNAKNKEDETPLHLAVAYRSSFTERLVSRRGVTFIKLLLNMDADADAQNINGETPLHLALFLKDIPKMEFLLNRSADINNPKKDGKTPLHLAVSFDNISIVRLLLERNAFVNATDARKVTPLHLSVACKNTSIMKILLDTNADPNVRNTEGETPLHWAVLCNDIITKLELLLTNKFFNMDLRRIQGETPSYWEAICNEIITKIEFLLHRGAGDDTWGKYKDIALEYWNATLNKITISLHASKIRAEQSTHNRFGLYWANLYSNLFFKIIRLFNTNAEWPNEGSLAKKKRKMKETAQNSTIPSHWTKLFSLYSLHEYFIRPGINLRLNDWMTPSDWDMLYKEIISKIELLLINGKVDARDIDGKTPLFWAVLCNDVSMAKLLLSKNADVDARDNNKMTPLFWAVIHKNTSMVALLLNNGADAKAQINDGSTCLHIAMMANVVHLPIIELLIEYKANVNAQDVNKVTPLHFALRLNYIDIITVLLNHGADVMLKNKDGDTPVYYAHLLEVNKEILDLLRTAEMKAILLHNPNNKDITPKKGKREQSKSTNDSGLSGQLYETKLLSLILIRLLNHLQVDDFFIGANVDLIGATDDICIRYRIKSQDRPVMLLMQSKDLKKFTDGDLWKQAGDFSLLKYFESYLMVRKSFQVGNKDPLFEGNFCDVDCYFVLYTSATPNFTKKNTDNKINEILHALIYSEDNKEPFQYNYNESDLHCLAEVVATVQTGSKSNCKANIGTQLAKDFFNRLWFYHSQARQDKVEYLVKNEISTHYNKENEATAYKFKIHTNAIFSRSHHNIQKWWKTRIPCKFNPNKFTAPYLCRSNDYFKEAKLAYLKEGLRYVTDFLNYFKIDATLHLNYYASKNQRQTNIATLEEFITKKNILYTSINEDDYMIIPVNMNLKHQFINVLNDSVHNSHKVIPKNKPHENQTFVYHKRTGTSEASGILFRTKVICLLYLRLLHNDQIEKEPSPLLGAKIHGISKTVKNDICFRCHVKSHQKPVVMFMRLKYKYNLEKARLLVEEELWTESGDLSLHKHFATYITIKELFKTTKKDLLMKGQFHNMDCYFGFYTSAKENLTKKKKSENEVNNVVHDLINSGENAEPFQYDYNEADIDLLIRVLDKNEIEKLGTFFREYLRRPEKYYPNLLNNKLIMRYHMVMGREVLQPCVEQPTANLQVCREWQFRSEFFKSDLEYLATLRKIIYEYFPSESDQEKLKSSNINLPHKFGNLDMTFDGQNINEGSIEVVLKAVANKFMHLMELNKNTKVIEITEGTIETCIASAVGNLLIFDKASKMLKFDLESEVLPYNATLFLRELKDDKYKPFNEYLKNYRIKINIDTFPKTSFYGDEYDKIQARDFLNKFWFYCDQAKEDELERIFKNEMRNKRSRNTNLYNNNNILDFVPSYSHDVIQKWWINRESELAEVDGLYTDTTMQIKDPYLSRASQLFEHAEQAYIGNHLQSVINFMYVLNIHSFDINIIRINKADKSEVVCSFFKTIVTKLFNLFKPEFNSQIYLSSIINSGKVASLRLKIHPELKWVTLLMIFDMTYYSHFIIDFPNYIIAAKVEFSNDKFQVKHGLDIKEYYCRYSRQNKFWLRDCLEEESIWVLQSTSTMPSIR